MSIEQEKMIVESLSSLYPLKDYEEEAIHAVLDAIPHWIPVTERLPESAEDDLEYPTVLVCFDNGDVGTACFYESTREWGCGDMYDRICYPIAWMPLPEAFKAVTDGRD